MPDYNNPLFAERARELQGAMSGYNVMPDEMFSGNDMQGPGIGEMTTVRQGGYTTNPEARMAIAKPQTFGEAFRMAKNAGLSVFEYNGKRFTTETKEEQIAKQSLKVAGVAMQHANHLENRKIQNEGKVQPMDKGTYEMMQTFGITPPSENAMGSRPQGVIRQAQFGGPNTRLAQLGNFISNGMNGDPANDPAMMEYMPSGMTRLAEERIRYRNQENDPHPLWNAIKGMF